MDIKKTWAEKLFATYNKPACIGYAELFVGSDCAGYDDVAIKCYIRSPNKLGKLLRREPEVVVSTAGDWVDASSGKPHVLRYIRTDVFTKSNAYNAVNTQYFSGTSNSEIDDFTDNNLKIIASKKHKKAPINRDQIPFISINTGVSPKKRELLLQDFKESNTKASPLLNNVMTKFLGATTVSLGETKRLVTKLTLPATINIV